MPVPPFRVIPTDIFDRHIAPIRSEINSWLQSLGSSVTDEIAIVSKHIRGLIREQPIATDSFERIESRLRTCFRSDTRLAVRSSAVDEDSPHASFAGILDSRLNVPPELVPEAVIAVWQSAFSEHALAYRIRHGLPLDRIAVAVIIQEFVPTSVSGVLFTKSIDANSDCMTISAAFGIGDGIVSGKVECDTYHVPRHGGCTRAEIRSKRTSIGARIDNRGGTIPISVKSANRTRPTLTQTQLNELKTVGLLVERVFETPQDIEWGYDNRNRLYVMQSRPITAPACGSSAEPVWLFDNANIVESYPGVTLPLTFSFVSQNYEALFCDASCGLIVNRNRLKRRTDIWSNLLVLIKGRVYYNLSAWYAMLSHLPVFSCYRRIWDKALGVANTASHARTAVSPVDHVYCLVRLAGILLFVRSRAKRFLKRCDTLLAPFRSDDFATEREPALLARYRMLQHSLLKLWPTTVYNDLVAFVYDHLLRKLCDRWGRSDSSQLYTSLITRSGDLESMAPLRSLLGIVDLFLSRTLYRDVLGLDDLTAWQEIQDCAALRPLKRRLDRHIEQYGDRCFEELKLESFSFHDQPAALVGLIRDYAGHGHCTVRQATEEQPAPVRSFRTLVLALVANRARTAIANRESMRLARTRAYGIVRRIFTRLGTLLSERNVIEHPRDIFFLTVDEVFGAVEGKCVTADLARLVQQRRSEFEAFERDVVPDSFSSGIYPSCSAHAVNDSSNSSRHLSGTGCVAGIVGGPAKLITDPGEAGDCSGSVLITRTTDPSWVFLMVQAAAVVSERGSVLSHTAIVGRELGIPTVVGVQGAVSAIRPGAEVTVNGTTGDVSWN